MENERKTADAAYAAALTVIDSTISRAQTYSERMTGMKANQFTDLTGEEFKAKFASSYR